MIFEKIKKEFPLIRENEPLKNHCSFRVGGPADLFYQLDNTEELPEIISLAENNSIKYKIIGRGTNILFTDKGFRGLIIKNVSKKYEIEENSIIADSGMLLAQLIRISADSGLSGLELLYGIPGSIGGAIFGNGGVPGTVISDFLEYVVLFNAADGVREIQMERSLSAPMSSRALLGLKEKIEFKYRWSSLQNGNDIILRAKFQLKKGKKETSKEFMEKLDAIRHSKQPTGWSAGSFFKNPSPEKSAGYLIEQVGLKGEKIGDAQISEKHANFILNTGHATAEQILALALKAKQKVKEKFSINLEMEVKIIGDL